MVRGQQSTRRSGSIQDPSPRGRRGRRRTRRRTRRRRCRVRRRRVRRRRCRRRRLVGRPRLVAVVSSLSSSYPIERNSTKMKCSEP